jgi:hypothetical protein
MNFKALILVVLTASTLLSPDVGAAPPEKDEVIPLIEMENVLLPDAIRQLARQAHLNILLDPRLSEPPLSRLAVTIRWQDVTAREALVALLDNYGLILVER